MIRFLLMIELSMVAINLMAQQKLAIINDKDGFVNVRDGGGKEFAIIDTIKTGKIISCQLDTSQWLKVHLYKKELGALDGYIHKSRVRFFDDLSDKEKKSLFQMTFINRKGLAERATKAYESGKQISLEDQKEFDEIDFSNSGLLLGVFSKYFCKTKDEETLDLFLEMRWAEKGSANESLGMTLTDCYVCDSKIVIDHISNFRLGQKRRLLYNDIQYYLEGYTSNSKYADLKKQLEFAMKYK